MLPDTRILSRHGEFAAIGECQVIVFPDNSTIYLHEATRRGADETFLRAMRHGDHWLVFDLRSLSRSFALDFAALPIRDRSGVVLYTIRQNFPTVAPFRARAVEHMLHCWMDHGADDVQRQLFGNFVESMSRQMIDAFGMPSALVSTGPRPGDQRTAA